jgi:NAD-dependent dihydropyrimidine dehydrogenase PreA subunit
MIKRDRATPSSHIVQSTTRASVKLMSRQQFQNKEIFRGTSEQALTTRSGFLSAQARHRVVPARLEGAMNGGQGKRGGGRRGMQSRTGFRPRSGGGICRRGVTFARDFIPGRQPSLASKSNGQTVSAENAPVADQKRQGEKRPMVNKELCCGCGTCVDACPMGAISLSGGKAVIDTEHCVKCGVCVFSCPQKAITLIE